jgi:hypothetical protein
MDKLPIAGRSAHAMDQIIPARRRQQPYPPFVFSRRFLRTSPVESRVQGVHYDIEPPDFRLGRSDLRQQIEMPLQHPEQFNQGQRRFGFPVLVT